jgi:hypothetical protein
MWFCEPLHVWWFCLKELCMYITKVSLPYQREEKEPVIVSLKSLLLRIIYLFKLYCFLILISESN